MNDLPASLAARSRRPGRRGVDTMGPYRRRRPRWRPRQRRRRRPQPAFVWNNAVPRAPCYPGRRVASYGPASVDNQRLFDDAVTSIWRRRLNRRLSHVDDAVSVERRVQDNSVWWICPLSLAGQRVAIKTAYSQHHAIGNSTATIPPPRFLYHTLNYF